MNTLDIIVLGVIAVSALFAFVRGFVREALSIAAWGGAAAATVYGLPYAQPFGRRLIANVSIADLATLAALFVGALILLSIATSMISSGVRSIGLGALDRALGLLFGMARGAFIVCLGYLILTYVMQQPADRPKWVTEAHSLKLLAWGAEELKQLIPRDMRDHGVDAVHNTQQRIDQLQTTEEAVRALAVPAVKPAATPGGTYDAEELKSMNRAIQSVQ